MTRLRSIFTVLLAALLITTFQQMAAARGLAPAVDEAVLCLGGVQVSVPVDASGNPAKPSHFCPDCIAHAFVDSGDTGVGAEFTTISAVAFGAAETFVVLATRPQTLRARGPPSYV